MWADAVSAFDKLIRADGKNASGWDHKGIGLSRQELHQDALSSFETAINLDGTCAPAWYNKACELTRSGSMMMHFPHLTGPGT